MLKATTRLACCEDILPPTSRSGGEVYAITQVLICTRQVSTTTTRCLEFRTRLWQHTEWLVKSPAHPSTTAEARQKKQAPWEPIILGWSLQPRTVRRKGANNCGTHAVRRLPESPHQARNPAGTATPSSSRVAVDCERTGEVLKC